MITKHKEKQLNLFDDGMMAKQFKQAIIRLCAYPVNQRGCVGGYTLTSTLIPPQAH